MHIGISGPIASGKSTLAKSLQAVFDLMDIKTRIVPFAEDLKWMASLYGNKEIIRQLELYFRKLGFPNDVVDAGIIQVLYAMMLYPPVDGVKPRKLFQYIGTEAGRYTVDENLWIKAVQQKIQTDSINKYFISDDLRFANEALAVHYHVQILTEGYTATAAYEARKTLFPQHYFFSDHESENDVLPPANYTIPTDFTTPQVIHLAKSINHVARSKVILTQNDLPAAFRDFGTALGNTSL